MSAYFVIYLIYFAVYIVNWVKNWMVIVCDGNKQIPVSSPLLPNPSSPKVGNFHIFKLNPYNYETHTSRLIRFQIWIQSEKTNDYQSGQV